MLPLHRGAGRVLAALVLALVVSLGGSAASAANAADPNTCQLPKGVPVDAISTTCPQGGAPTSAPSPEPKPAPSAAPQKQAPSSPPAKQPAGSGQQGGGAQPGVKFGEQEEPVGWAGPIAKDLGQGVQGLSSDLAKRLMSNGLLPKFEFSRAYVTLYAVMYGLGVAVAALATMVAAVKVAAANGVDSRILAQHALVRLLTFSAVGAMAPLLLAQLGQVAHALAGGFFDMAAAQLAAQLNWLATALAVGTLASLVVPGGSAVMAGLFLFLLASLAAVWLELAISHYLVFFLGLFIPILYAASIHPDWRRGMVKLRGALMGAFLAPAALFLVWVVAGTAVAPWTSDNGFLARAGMLIVGLLLSLAAPIAVGLVLSYVVPAFAGGHGYDTGSVRAAASRVRHRGRGYRSAGPRSSRSKRASEAADEGPSTPVERPSQPGPAGATKGAGSRALPAGPGGAGGAAPAAGAGGAAAGGAGGVAAGGGAAGASAAAGPVGAAAVVFAKLMNKVRRTAEGTRDAVAGATQEAAGRGGDDGGSPGPASGGPPARRGGASGRLDRPGPGGSEHPAAPAGASGVPTAVGATARERTDDRPGRTSGAPSATGQGERGSEQPDRPGPGVQRPGGPDFQRPGRSGPEFRAPDAGGPAPGTSPSAGAPSRSRDAGDGRVDGAAG